MRQYKGEEKRSAVDVTIDRLLQYLQDQGLGDGDRLPNERDLCVLLEVGRSTLRAETMRTHRAVLDAIRARDSVAASDAMYLHLIYNRDRIRPDSILLGGSYSK